MARLADLVRESGAAVAAVSAHTGSFPATVSRQGRMQQWYEAAHRELIRIREDVRAGISPRVSSCQPLAQALVLETKSSDAPLQWALRGQTSDYVIDNAVNVAILGITMGIGLRSATESLVELALAGLLHDVGMWTLPDSILAKPGPLSADELEAVRSHPERGRRILAALGRPYDAIAAIVAQEHERWDGSGYPGRLKGEAIAESAQIIGMADLVDALITPRPYKKRVTPHHALREVLVHEKHHFSHPILKALGDQVTLYPVGSSVRLNTGERGTVARTNPRYPLRPVLEIEGRSPGESNVDLTQSQGVHIVEVLS